MVGRQVLEAVVATSLFCGNKVPLDWPEKKLQVRTVGRHLKFLEAGRMPTKSRQQDHPSVTESSSNFICGSYIPTILFNNPEYCTRHKS